MRVRESLRVRGGMSGQCRAQEIEGVCERMTVRVNGLVCVSKRVYLLEREKL